jgi:hypothetical protein
VDRMRFPHLPDQIEEGDIDFILQQACAGRRAAIPRFSLIDKDRVDSRANQEVTGKRLGNPVPHDSHVTGHVLFE